MRLFNPPPSPPQYVVLVRVVIWFIMYSDTNGNGNNHFQQPLLTQQKTGKLSNYVERRVLCLLTGLHNMAKWVTAIEVCVCVRGCLLSLFACVFFVFNVKSFVVYLIDFHVHLVTRLEKDMENSPAIYRHFGHLAPCIVLFCIVGIGKAHTRNDIRCTLLVSFMPRVHQTNLRYCYNTVPMRKYIILSSF